MTTTYKDIDAKGKSAVVTWGDPVDAAGNKTGGIQGTAEFASSNEDVATVEPDPSSPLGVKVTFTGLNGSTDVSIKADADLGDGVDEITDLVTFVIETTEATGFGAPTVGDLQ